MRWRETCSGATITVVNVLPLIIFQIPHPPNHSRTHSRTHTTPPTRHRRQTPRSNGIEAVLNARVAAVERFVVRVVDAQTEQEMEIPFGACVWATGVAMNPLLHGLRDKLPEQANFRSLVTDGCLRVKGAGGSIFAIGAARRACVGGCPRRGDARAGPPHVVLPLDLCCTPYLRVGGACCCAPDKTPAWNTQASTSRPPTL